MKLLAALWLVLQLISTVFGQCGPAACYSGCTDSRVALDLIFIIDVSGSMQEEINGVVSGLTQFATDLEAQSVIPWYTLIVFGNSNDQAVVKLNAETSASTFKNTMAAISVNGGWEPGLETIKRALGTASTQNFAINLRSGSKRAIILITDEDSDPAYFSANRYQSSGNDAHDGNCGPNNMVQYQSEIDDTVKSIIAGDFSAYLLVKVGTGSSTCLTARQYGNYDLQVQSTDFKTFDAAATLQKLKDNSVASSIQGQMLSAGEYARVFKVESLSSSTFVKNFFQTITTDISVCDTTCYFYPCSSTNTCLAPVNICGCDGVAYSNKTYDGYGGCCLNSEKDCTGKCKGTSFYDECGVCVSSGRSSLCVKDCANSWYLTSKPTVNYTSDSFQPDSAGYLLMNSDLYTQFATTSGTLRSIDLLKNHFHVYGRFEGRYVCTFDANRYATQYSVSASTAKDHWLNNLLSSTTTKNQAYCVTNSRIKLPPTSTDSCGQCVTTPDTPPYCAKDCSGILRTSAASAYFYDNCGVCVAPGTNSDANKDDCGVCFGKNVNKNQCGVCFGTTALDGCGNPVCQGITCTKNCDGVSETTITKELDPCGYCVTIGAISPICLQDCAGKYYSQGTTPTFKKDECNVCVSSSITRSPDCKQDCSGVWNGTAYYDTCNQCVDGKDDFTCAQDCDGNYYLVGKESPIFTLDSCNECNTAQDQNKLKDKCGICKNKSGYNSTAQCTQDCKGIWLLTSDNSRSFIDFCGDCWYANQSNSRNYRMDDCGVCHESRDDPEWNKDRKVDAEGNKCSCFVDPQTCTNLTGSTYLSCLDCPSLNPCAFGIPDSCGLCPGKSMYGKKDKCGICCSPEDGVACDVDVDDCGVCFGMNKQKDLNACKICDASKCIVDCLGIPNGTAIVGCDGICNSNAKCAYCGNGVLDDGETCDLGNGMNTKGSGCYNCQTERGNATGSIIGGIVGGIAAIAFLGVAGFFAYQYAARNGLIGKAGKNVDLSGSNNNPLFTSNTKVASNPLYIN